MAQATGQTQATGQAQSKPPTPPQTKAAAPPQQAKPAVKAPEPEDPIPPPAPNALFPAVVARVNEEHGILDLTQASLTLRVGDKVEVIPNHCCVTVNLHDEMTVVRNGDIVETWPIAARGRMR